jgi:hypothetical protein
VLTPGGDRLDFCCAFHPRPATPPPTPTPPSPPRKSTGPPSGLPAPPSISPAPDPRARELERRIVLSQYQTAIQCAGSLPPQETGLTCNSWYGKFHLEMHYWHAAHFATWGRPALLERSLGWYNAILPACPREGRQQGYTGARWPKMTAPDGRDSPSNVGPLLIWQQPHPIAMAELIYAAHPTRDTLARYRDMVFESAEFMASYAHYDPKSARYVLGPPVIPAQENHPARETWNPTFELEYWDHALDIAQRWRERGVCPREPKWDDVRAKLSALPVKDGVYLAHENCPQTFTERNRDHPSMLGALGVLPGRKVDRETMRRTLRKVFAEWKWADTWGWDFPMVAMTAASLNEPATGHRRAHAMDTPKNTWLPNGHNWQRANLPLYLPGNGGLLLAIAHMVRENAFPKTSPLPTLCGASRTRGNRKRVPRFPGHDGLLRGHLLLGMGRHRPGDRRHPGGALRFAARGLGRRGGRHGHQGRAGGFRRRRRPAVDPAARFAENGALRGGGPAAPPRAALGGRDLLQPDKRSLTAAALIGVVMRPSEPRP